MDLDEVRIEKGIPVPIWKRKSKYRRFTEGLSDGDSFVLTGSLIQGIRFYLRSSESTYYIATRKEGEGFRCWFLRKGSSNQAGLPRRKIRKDVAKGAALAAAVI